MKASTLFSVTVALFLGLAVAVGAKYSGLFSPKPPTPVPQPKPKLKVVVAAKNLFEGYTIGPTDVVLRDMTEEEETFYREHKDQFMPPKLEAAALRTLNRSVEADQPILRDYLDEINLPQAINRRLSSPMMRAVNITLPPERAAGGLIARGEYVDVNLTTRIFVAGKPRSFSSTETATIARNLKVIVKRNQLWNQLAPVDPAKPITFTLEANVYRAALIEFAKTKGDLALIPTATPPDIKGTRSSASTSFSDPSSKEYADEDERVAKMQRGEYAVGDPDLERIFGLRPPEGPNYKPPGQIEQWAGTRFKGMQTFGNGDPRANSNTPIRPNTGQPSYYAFGPLNSKAENGGFYDGPGATDRREGVLTLPGSATEQQRSQ